MLEVLPSHTIQHASFPSTERPCNFSVLSFVLQVVAPYAKSVIYAAYKDDKAVADDHEVQAFGAALVAQHGSNLGRINDENNKLQTRAQVAKFVEDYVTIVLTHGSAHLQVSVWSAGDAIKQKARSTSGSWHVTVQTVVDATGHQIVHQHKQRCSGPRPIIDMSSA